MDNIFNKYFGPEELKLAFFRVRSWSYSQIKDQVGLREFGSKLNENVKFLSQKLHSGNYSPKRGFKFYMPKASNTFRTQTQLCIEDAIVYQAIANKLAERSGEELEKYKAHVFGSILSEECKKGVGLLNQKESDFEFFKEWGPLHKQFRDAIIKTIEVDQSVFKLETDITGFFDAIPHYNLFKVLQTEFDVEIEIIELLELCLNEWSGTRDGRTHGVGIPQGPAPSYLLANMFLYNLDSELINQGLDYFRYMDDIKVYGYERKKMQKLLHTIDKYTKSNGLSINSKKTSIEEMNPQNKEETIKSLKKLSLVSFNSEFLFDLESTGGDLEKTKGTDHVKTDYQNLVEKLKKMIVSDHDNFILQEGVDDIDFIQQSVIFKDIVTGLKEVSDDFEIGDELIPYWLFGVRTFFWRASSILMSLSYYKGNSKVKEGLINLYEEFEDYEWVRFYLITHLSFNHNFSEEDLSDRFLNFLKSEENELPRIALYRLMLVHAKSKVLKEKVQAMLDAEESEHVKYIIQDFKKHRISGEEKIELIRQFFSS